MTDNIPNIVLYRGNCLDVMKRLPENSIDFIVTSPPYNTTPHLSSNSKTNLVEEARHREEYYPTNRYDEFNDSMPNEEYAKFVADVFDGFNRILKPNGCVAWNVGIGAENTAAMFLSITEVIKRSAFMVADQLIWRKRTAMPQNASQNLSTRCCENVFVFCRPNERTTFHSNKKVTSTRATGQPYFEVVYNIFEASNNDGHCPLNHATYSSEFVIELLNRYCPKGGNVFDPFLGSGTTAFACRGHGENCVGSELSLKQCEYAFKRLGNGEDMFTRVSMIDIKDADTDDGLIR